MAAAQPSLKKPKIVGSACDDPDGVTEVVDFRNLVNNKGHKMNVVRIGCAPWPVRDGFAALSGAGFRYESSSGFLCTIDNRPLDEAGCPAGDGYWHYAHGTRGGDWTSAGGGAGSWNPPQGSLEGWSWQPYAKGSKWQFPRVTPKELFPPALAG